MPRSHLPGAKLGTHPRNLSPPIIVDRYVRFKRIMDEVSWIKFAHCFTNYSSDLPEIHERFLKTAPGQMSPDPHRSGRRPGCERPRSRPAGVTSFEASLAASVALARGSRTSFIRRLFPVPRPVLGLSRLIAVPHLGRHHFYRSGFQRDSWGTQRP